MLVPEETFALMGKALYKAQRVEFILYGIASHLGHLKEAKKDKIFAKITANDFLSDDPEKSKMRTATLGRLYRLFGKRLLLKSVAFDLFVSERNFIVHELFRSMSRNQKMSDHNQRLIDFIELSETTEKAMKGLLSELTEASAKKEGRMSELQLTPEDKINRNYYKAFVVLNMHANKEIELPGMKGVLASSEVTP